MTAAAAVARPPARLRRRVRWSPARTARRSRRESSAMVARGAREKSYSWHAAGTCRGPGSSAIEIAASRAGPPVPWFPPSRPTGARSTAASKPVAPVSRTTGATPCRAQLLHASGWQNRQPHPALRAAPRACRLPIASDTLTDATPSATNQSGRPPTPPRTKCTGACCDSTKAESLRRPPFSGSLLLPRELGTLAGTRSAPAVDEQQK
jgi:hypothetical protein